MNLVDYERFNRLYDLYGNLLTDKQREMVEMHIRDDLSLFEISEYSGISKQAVSDALAKAKQKLEYYETKLCLLDKVTLTAEIINSDKSAADISAKLKVIWKEFIYEES